VRPAAFGWRGFYQSKMSELTYHGKVSRSKEITLPKKIRKEVGEMFAGKQIEVVFRRKKKHRTPSQNAYYWAVVVPLILEEFVNLGNDLQVGNKEHIDLIHDMLKGMFLEAKEVVDADGVAIKLPPTTKDLSTVQFMEYLEKVCQFAAERLQLVIPEPETQGEFWG